jgi:CRP-like cAMP-binding protein
MELTLKKVKLFETMDPYDLMNICDGMKDIKFKANEFVIK